MSTKFDVKYDDILRKIHHVDPVKYGKTRNFIDGAVSYLSPYISRGVISTKMVLNHMLNSGYSVEKIESFVQELAWRDYWQQIWIARGSEIDADIRNPQPRADRAGVPLNIINGKTGIQAIDKGIAEFYKTGYLHNHLRMYIASCATNLGRCGWIQPAQWMYYHLLDADWASNALSWQWICGAKSNKLYFANQENINKYCNTNQTKTFLDVSYEEIETIGIPDELRELETFQLKTKLPKTSFPNIQNGETCFLYNFYNLDPIWRKDEAGARILLLEPSVFEKYPVSEKSIQFCIDLAIENIPNIQIYVGEFSDLQRIPEVQFIFKEHPLNAYEGIQDEREGISSVKGDFPSFFAFWKKVKKELQ
ncbi:MAG: deoxyribodipyrimidine photolyase [Flavobacteriales bacterium]|nr:deoxyribodipyrimidine photolyase [Flavobacteriales bacterium]